MIQLFTFISPVRRVTPLVRTRTGKVRLGAGIFGVYDARGRAP